MFHLEFSQPVNLLSLIGAVLNIAAVLLVFRFGLPSKIESLGKASGGASDAADIFTDTQNPEKERQRQKRVRKRENRSNVALIVFLAGLLLQLLGSFITLSVCK